MSWSARNLDNPELLIKACISSFVNSFRLIFFSMKSPLETKRKRLLVTTGAQECPRKPGGIVREVGNKVKDHGHLTGWTGKILQFEILS